MQISLSNKAAATLAAVAAVAVPLGVAHADGGLSTPFHLKFGTRVLPTTHAVEILDAADIQDGREYDYTVKGTFKVAGKAIARMRTVRGHADATRQSISIPISRTTRRSLSAAARKHHTRRAVLSLVYTVRPTKNPQGAFTGSYSGSATLNVR